MFGRSRRGQAMLEYVIAFASLLVVVAVLGILVSAARRQADRSQALVTADCP